MPRSPHPPRRATLASLAAELNVSRTTISNAYNRPDQLSADLRERVLAAAKRLGYPGPDPVARSLRTRRAEAVGLVIPEPLTYAFSDPAALEFVAGLAESCEEAGQGLLLVAAGPGREVPDGSVLAAGVDGFVVYAAADDDPYLGAVRERGLPTVIVDQPRDVPGTSWVGIDDRAAMRELAEQVIGYGHREMALITMRLGPRTGETVQIVDERRLAATRFTAQSDRIAGVRDAMAAAGLDPETLTVVETLEHQPESGGRAAELALDTNPRVTALLCTADVLAFSAMDRLRGRGIYAPGQLSITGFDGVPEALRRGLTTVVQPTVDKGRRAGRLLLNPPRNGLPVAEVLDTEVFRGRTLGPPAG
ncbi:MAG: LacI family DNA-binding transcriptional regulator [Mycolicibacterium sp.]|nr:LacI family DNA-binding transcriptional regulator [Mycolicibacterium sp.]